MSTETQPEAPVLYCNCAFARVVPDDVKAGVLERLVASGASFEAVADLCELSARKDPALKRLAAAEDLRVAACYPRAVKWLFKAGNADLPESARVVNMRVQDADAVLEGLTSEEWSEPEDEAEAAE